MITNILGLLQLAFLISSLISFIYLFPTSHLQKCISFVEGPDGRSAMPNPGVPNKIIIFKKYIYIGLYIYCKPVADPGFLEGGGRRQFGWRGGGRQLGQMAQPFVDGNLNRGARLLRPPDPPLHTYFDTYILHTYIHTYNTYIHTYARTYARRHPHTHAHTRARAHTHT